MTTTPRTKPIDDVVDHATSAPTVSWWMAAIAGLIAAGAALGITELLAGLTTRIPSLIDSVADLVVENGFETLDNFSRSTFGTSQKTALLTGIPLTTLLLGVVTGVIARRRVAIGWAVFAAFGLVGIYATRSDELANNGGGVIAAVVAAVVGAAVLTLLLQVAAHRAPAENGVGRVGNFLVERRRFVATGGGFALGSVIAAQIGTSKQNSRNVEGDRAEVAAELDTAPVDSAAASDPLVDVATFDDVDGIASLVTPNDDFYLIDTAVQKPLINIDTWRLRVDGMVDTPYELSFAELLEMDTVEVPVTLSCVSNEVGGGLVGNAIWRGVPLVDILDRAGVDPSTATQLVGRSEDGWTGGFPTELAYDGRTAIVAFAMNGEPLPVKHGFPARLVVSGLYGYVSATKWLTNIELTTWEDFDGFWIPRGWSKEGPIKTQSRIDVPSRNARIAPRLTAVAGVAWAPNRSVAMVEVSVDDGEWMEARLSDELSGDSWRQWMFEWDATPGEHLLKVRATDGDGNTQTPDPTPPRPDGAAGHHTIAVRVA